MFLAVFQGGKRLSRNKVLFECSFQFLQTTAATSFTVKCSKNNEGPNAGRSGGRRGKEQIVKL